MAIKAPWPTNIITLCFLSSVELEEQRCFQVPSCFLLWNLWSSQMPLCFRYLSLCLFRLTVSCWRTFISDFCVFYVVQSRLMANHSCWMDGWVGGWMVDGWLWCVEAQRCIRAQLDGKKSSTIDWQECGMRWGEWLSQGRDSALRLYELWVMLRSLDFIPSGSWEKLTVPSAKWQSWVFSNILLWKFSTMYKNRIPLMDHHVPIHHPASTIISVLPILF